VKSADESSNARNMRGCHTRSRLTQVYPPDHELAIPRHAAVGQGGLEREDGTVRLIPIRRVGVTTAGCRNINFVPVIGEGCFLVEVIGGGNGDDGWEAGRGKPILRSANVCIAIPRRSDEHDVLHIVGVVNGIPENLRSGAAAAPAGVDYHCPIIGCIHNCLREPVDNSPPVVPQPFDCHHLCHGGDSDDAFGVVTNRCDGSCNVCPVPKTIHGIIVAVVEVPPSTIINVSIVIIVNAIRALPSLPWIFPHVRSDVIVGRIDAGIRDCDDNSVSL